MRCVRALKLLSTPQKTNSEKNAVKKYSGIFLVLEQAANGFRF